MEHKPTKEQLLFKMFESALKEKFHYLAKKYGPEQAFQAWVHWVRNEKTCTFPESCRWKLEMSLSQALDKLDNYFTSVEKMVQKEDPPK